MHEEIGPAAGRGRRAAPRGRGAGAAPRDEDEEPEAGVEIEVTPPGKSTKRLSLLSGGEKSLVALAFMFAVFLARPCPFYILDEVEAALDDINIDRFLQLVKRYSDRAQFIVVTHQKRTMDAADTLYGVSMGGDGISRVVSRKLAGRPAEESPVVRRGGRGLDAASRGGAYPPRAMARTWQELFETGDDAPAADRGRGRRARARAASSGACARTCRRRARRSARSSRPRSSSRSTTRPSSGSRRR